MSLPVVLIEIRRLSPGSFVYLKLSHFGFLFIVVAKITTTTAVGIWKVLTTVRIRVFVLVFSGRASTHVLLLCDYVNLASCSRLSIVTDICSAARTQGLAYQPSFNALCVKKMLRIARKSHYVGFNQRISAYNTLSIVFTLNVGSIFFVFV